MSGPVPPKTTAYRNTITKAAPDGRLFSPSFDKNAVPILDRLSDLMRGVSGTVLEIGSGTGQHAATLANALPALHFVPSDPDPTHRTSIHAWQAHGAKNMATPLDLDAGADWAGDPAVRDLGSLQLILSINVIHIAPPNVMSGILSGAADRLAATGKLVFYGPFMENGAHTGAGNQAFDAHLKSRNSQWGLRDIAEIRQSARAFGLSMVEVIPMPSNNRMLVLSKPAISA